ncbi:MAG: hypothetical protein ACRD17_11695 [Terriglobales bacterium]
METRPVLDRQYALLRNVVRLLGAFPGDKTMIYIGDGFMVHPSDMAYLAYAACFGDDPSLAGELAFQDDVAPLRDISDLAAQLRVRISTVDTRGLQAVDGLLLDFADDEQSPMLALAHGTGGEAYLDNDIIGGIGQVQGPLEGVYYASYASTNRRLDRSYRKIVVRVLRGGIRVRTRPGYRAVLTRSLSAPACVARIRPAPSGADYRVAVRCEGAGADMKWSGKRKSREDDFVVVGRLRDAAGELLLERTQYWRAAPDRSGGVSYPIAMEGVASGAYILSLHFVETATGNFADVRIPLAVGAAR